MIRLLDRIRVLDLSRLLPGGYCTQLLADLGAAVLKVEEPGRGDYLRQVNPWVFGAMNRNKKSIALDLKHARGREILVRLVKGHDVLLESFRPGVMDRLGLGYEKLRHANPGIIYCSLTGYGQDGPYRQKSGHDLNYLAVAGVLGLTTDPGELPVALPMPLADIAGGLMASHAILAALAGRGASGKGCRVDAAMTDAALSFMSVRLALAMGTGKIRRQDLIRGGAYDVYRTRDGRFITLGVIEDKFWGNLTRAIGREDLARDPRFSTDRLRTANRGAVREILEGILAQRTLESWMALFQAEDVPAAPVNMLDEIDRDPQLRHRALVFGLKDDAGRECKQVGYPALFPGLERSEDWPAPPMGRDGREILSTLGCDEEEIQSLVDQGIVSIPPRPEHERAH